MPVRKRRRGKPSIPRKSTLRFGVVPADQTSFTGADLCALAGARSKALATWRKAGLLPPAPVARRGARYSRDEARRACAIGKAGIAAARLPRFAEMIPFILNEAPPPGAPQSPPEGGRTDAGAAVPGSSEPPSVEAASPPPGLSDEAEVPGLAWKRIELLPGLELHLVEGASPVLRALVREVARRFGRSV